MSEREKLRRRQMKTAKAEIYEMLTKEFNDRVDHYNKCYEARRWDTPEYREARGRACGFINGLGWAIDTLFPEMKEKAHD